MKILPFKSSIPAGLCLASTIGLTACGGTSETTSNTGESTSSSQLSIAITDAPIDSATSVVVNVVGVEVKPAAAGSLSFVFCADQKSAVSEEDCNSRESKAIDLLSLTGTQSMDLLDAIDIPAGEYNWIRLALDETNPASIDLDDGSRHLLDIPSADQSGLKLNHGFTATQGGATSLTIDVDLRKSIHKTGNDVYKMRPTLRIVDNSEVGSLSGEVFANLITSDCSPAVYLYQGAGISADDTGSNNEPITSAVVTLDNSGDYRFEIGFLEAGAYTAAFTCEADLDDPASNDDIKFLMTNNVTISAQNQTEITIQNSRLGGGL